MTLDLTRAEIDFLSSLKDLELDALMAELPKQAAKEIRQQLKDQQGQPKSESQLNENQPRSEPQNESRQSENPPNGKPPRSSRREANSEYARRDRRKAQDIGPLPFDPTGEDLEKRKLADASLLDHLTLVYPDAFNLAFSEDHLRLIKHIEWAADHGLLKALAMARGSGKTTLIVRAALWVLLTGRRRFVCIVAATDGFAAELLAGVKAELLHNATLARIYPRETHCLRMLQGEARLAGGQRLDDRLTGVEWKERRVNFGYAPGVLTSGCVLTAVGITSNLRGQQVVHPGGKVDRPDFLLIDDFQTKESAASPTQCQKRYELMMGDVLGLCGPDRTMSAVASGTVIYKRDAMDRILDRQTSPMWNGDRCSMVYTWPKDEKLWDRYRGILETELAAGGSGEKANQFVADHFEELHPDEVKVGWPARKPGCLSALQYAYNLRFRDEPSFWSEYQNQPISATIEDPYELDPVAIAARMNQCPRGEIPPEVEKITAFIDVQKRVLFFMVVGWEICGRGHVIDYGTFPDQRRLYFAKRNIGRTIQQVTKASNFRAAIYSALGYLAEDLFNREFVQSGGRRGDVVLTLNRVGIDARWGDSTDTVRKFCRESKYVGRITPVMGHYIGAKTRSWQKWKHSKTDVIGDHCKMMLPPSGIRGVRELLVDTNYWKTQTAEKLSCPLGADHAICLFQARAHVHRLVSEHFTAEECSLETADSGQSVIEWKQPHSGLDNDFWDTLVGNTVLSTLEGIRIDPTQSIASAKQRSEKEKATKNESQPATPGREHRQAARDERISDVEW